MIESTRSRLPLVASGTLGDFSGFFTNFLGLKLKGWQGSNPDKLPQASNSCRAIWAIFFAEKNDTFTNHPFGMEGMLGFLDHFWSYDPIWAMKITTNPPVGHPKWWFSRGIRSPKMAETIRLRIYFINCPGILFLDWFHILDEQLFSQHLHFRDQSWSKEHLFWTPTGVKPFRPKVYKTNRLMAELLVSHHGGKFAHYYSLEV